MKSLSIVAYAGNELFSKCYVMKASATLDDKEYEL